MIFFCMKGIKTKLEADDEKDKQAGGNAYCQANDIDKSIAFAAKQIPEGGFEIVFYHDVLFLLASGEWEVSSGGFMTPRFPHSPLATCHSLLTCSQALHGVSIRRLYSSY